MINTVQRGDVLTMVGPDGKRSMPFVLQDVPWTDGDFIWILRCDNAPIVVPHQYGVESSFQLHSRPRWPLTTGDADEQ
jgi:hypothetical protein